MTRCTSKKHLFPAGRKGVVFSTCCILASKLSAPQDMSERLFLPVRLLRMKLAIDRVRGRSLDWRRDLAHSSRASRLESLNLRPQHMNGDEASAQLTRLGS